MIWTFDSKRQHWHASTVANTAVQSNLYTIETGEGRSDEIEMLLSAIESAAAPGYEMLLAGKIPEGQERADFSMFLATQHLRTPAMINAVAQAQAELMDQLSDMLLSSREGYDSFAAQYIEDHGKPPVSYEKLLEFKNDKSRYHVTVSQKRGLSVIGAAERIAPILFQRMWFVCSPIEGYFITSDHPVVRFAPAGDSHELRGDGGFLNDRAETTFPLSPGRLLLITGDAPAEEGTPMLLYAEQVRAANVARAISAERYIYSHRRSDEFSELVAQRDPTQSRITIMGGTGERADVRVVR